MCLLLLNGLTRGLNGLTPNQNDVKTIPRHTVIDRQNMARFAKLDCFNFPVKSSSCLKTHPARVKPSVWSSNIEDFIMNMNKYIKICFFWWHLSIFIDSRILISSKQFKIKPSMLRLALSRGILTTLTSTSTDHKKKKFLIITINQQKLDLFKSLDIILKIINPYITTVDF